MKTCLLALISAALLGACAVPPQHPALQAVDTAPAHQGETPLPMPLPPLVPTRDYVADWHGNGGYQISPDGQRLMWAARKGLNQGLFVKDLASGVVHSYSLPTLGQWATDSRHVILHLESGNENTHVALLDSSQPTLALKALTPQQGVRATVHSTLDGSADLLITTNQRDPQVFDLYRYRADQDRLDLVAQNPGTVALWLTDRQGRLVGRASKAARHWVYEAQTAAQGPHQWASAFTVDLDDTVVPLQVARSGQQAWALSNRGRDKVALVQIDLRTGEEQVVYQDPRVDLARAYISHKTGQPLAVNVQPGLQEWHFFDPQLAQVATRLMGPHTRHMEVLSLSEDEQLLTAVLHDDQGGRNVLVDLRTGHSTVLGELGTSRIHAQSPLPPRTALHFASRDGLPLSGYLTLPQQTPPSPPHPWPTVVLVHGGPWARDTWDDRNLPDFLANRGYAVLQVNYRGSTGFGKAFEQAAKGEFAGKMHTDLLDGLDHLVQQGVSDPRRVALVGGSYGGYASLVGMTHTPGRFACAVSLNGVTDLPSLIRDFPPYWALWKDRWFAYAGDPTTPEGLRSLQDKSPLAHAHRVQGPILILQGLHDARVQHNQATRMVQALQQAGKPVRFVEFPKAGHGLYRWPDRLSFYRKTEDFLAGCLGGRSGGWDVFELVQAVL